MFFLFAFLRGLRCSALLALYSTVFCCAALAHGPEVDPPPQAPLLRELPSEIPGHLGSGDPAGIALHFMSYLQQLRARVEQCLAEDTGVLRLLDELAGCWGTDQVDIPIDVIGCGRPFYGLFQPIRGGAGRIRICADSFYNIRHLLPGPDVCNILRHELRHAVDFCYLQRFLCETGMDELHCRVVEEVYLSLPMCFAYELRAYREPRGTDAERVCREVESEADARSCCAYICDSCGAYAEQVGLDCQRECIEWLGEESKLEW